MTDDNPDGFSRRRLLSAGVLGVGAFGLGTGGLELLTDDRVEYTRTTLAQSEDGGADLVVDWKEWYTGTATDDVQDEPVDSEGIPVVRLENVLPGDSGKLAFGLRLDGDGDVEETELRMRLRMFTGETDDNGQPQPELAAGDDASDEGELHEYVELDAWYDTGFAAGDTPLYGHCDGEYQGAEEKIYEDTLETVAIHAADGDEEDDWHADEDPAGQGVEVLGCIPADEGLCVALEWTIPDDLPGVDDNVIQSDRTAFEIAFGAFECGE